MKININDRIKIKDAEGTVKYVGSLYEKEGVWVGILLDEEKGKNFGILGGKEYFDCNGKRRGIFIKEDLLVNDLMQSKISDDLRVSKDLDENLQARKYKKKYEKLKAHLAMIENLNDQKIKEIRERNKSALKIKDLEIQNLKKNSNTNLENDQVMKNETFILQKKEIEKLNDKINKFKINMKDNICKWQSILSFCMKRVKFYQEKIEINRNAQLLRNENVVLTQKQEEKIVVLDLLESITKKLYLDEDITDLYKKYNSIVNKYQ